jgi:hypothetical protein
VSELGIHPRGRDAHALLAARLAQLVKLRTVKQLAEDPGDLVFDDARAVVLDHDHKMAPAVVYLHADLGKDAGFLAGVERVVDGLPHRGDERLCRRIEAEQMTVLEEELRDRDVALARRHVEGGGGGGSPVRHDS